MTDACLCVCLRPHQYKRVVQNLFPKKVLGSEEGLQPQNISKLTHYATTHPSKLRVLARWVVGVLSGSHANFKMFVCVCRGATALHPSPALQGNRGPHQERPAQEPAGVRAPRVCV